MMHISQLQDTCRKCQEMCRKCYLHRFSQHIIFRLSCVQEMCLTHQISCVQEVYMKSHLSCFPIFSFMSESAYRKCEGSVLEMLCILATGNVPEMSCVLSQKICLKFCPILCNCTRKCQRNIKISWCGKFPYHEQEM